MSVPPHDWRSAHQLIGCAALFVWLRVPRES
jgi:hypothetical protein